VRLGIDIDIRHASSRQAGLALCEFIRQNSTRNMVVPSCTVRADNQVSIKAARVLTAVMAGSSSTRGTTSQGAHRIRLDDAAVEILEQEASRHPRVEVAVVVPHMFLLPLLRRFCFHLQACFGTDDPLVYVVPDYLDHDSAPCSIVRCYARERRRVAAFLRSKRIHCIDARRSLLLENLYSLAIYTIPAKYLLFVDDDVFLSDRRAIDRLVSSLRAGYRMVGYYDEVTQRVHTSFFGMATEALWASIDLFDDGENLYAETRRDTGSIAFAKLRSENSVAVLGPYRDGQNEWGFHLGHCASELWRDFPQILSHHGGPAHEWYDEIADVLKEVSPSSVDDSAYVPITDSVRRGAYSDPREYYSRVQNNLSWLTRMD